MSHKNLSMRGFIKTSLAGLTVIALMSCSLLAAEQNSNVEEIIIIYKSTLLKMPG